MILLLEMNIKSVFKITSVIVNDFIILVTDFLGDNLFTTYTNFSKN